MKVLRLVMDKPYFIHFYLKIFIMKKTKLTIVDLKKSTLVLTPKMQQQLKGGNGSTAEELAAAAQQAVADTGWEDCFDA